MKHLATSLIALLALGYTLNAQDSIPRFPLLEVFTSSTCGPCKGGNERINQIIVGDDKYDGKYAIVKYQMSWPSTGDPYYTSEAGGRRGIYGVTGVPNLQINGDHDLFPPQMTTAELDAELQRYSYLQITPHTTWSSDRKTVDVKVELKALSPITGPVHKLYVMVVEEITYNNRKSNGETEFEAVMKKMLPSNGEFVIGDLPKDTTLNFNLSHTFEGNYRLPNNANDPIDHQTEHSVEDFDNLHVIAFVQHLGTKEVLNAAYGYDPNDTSDPHHPNHNEDTTGSGGTNGIGQIDAGQNSFALYPNPAEGHFFIQSVNDSRDLTVQIVDLKGQVVYSESIEEVAAGSSVEITTDQLDAGMYLVQVKGEGVDWRERVMVR